MDQERNSDGVETGPAAALTDRLREVPRPEQSRMLMSLLREQIAAATGKPGPFPASAPFRQLGVYRDIATRLRDLLAAATGVRIPATLLFDYPTLDGLTTYLSREVFQLPTEEAEQDAGAARSQAAELEAIEDLSMDELEALLAEELEAVKSLTDGD